MNENVIKMARLMVGCKDRTCEDCLSQSKKLFGDNKCALIEYAEVLDKAGYRPEAEVRAETAKEIVKNILAFSYYIKFEDTNGKDREELVVYESKIKQLAEQFGKEEK